MFLKQKQNFEKKKIENFNIPTNNFISITIAKVLWY